MPPPHVVTVTRIRRPSLWFRSLSLKALYVPVCWFALAIRYGTSGLPFVPVKANTVVSSVLVSKFLCTAVNGMFPKALLTKAASSFSRGNRVDASPESDGMNDVTAIVHKNDVIDRIDRSAVKRVPVLSMACLVGRPCCLASSIYIFTVSSDTLVELPMHLDLRSFSNSAALISLSPMVPPPAVASSTSCLTSSVVKIRFRPLAPQFLYIGGGGRGGDGGAGTVSMISTNDYRTQLGWVNMTSTSDY